MQAAAKRIAFTVLIGSMALTCALYLVSSWLLSPSWDEQFQAEIESLQQTGSPIRPGDFAPSPISESQNAAVLYQEAFSAINRLYDQNAPKDEVTWADPMDWDALSGYVDHYREVLPILRKASQLPHCQYPIQYEKGLDIDLEKRAIIPAGRLLHAASRLAVHHRDHGNAVKYIEDMIALANSLSDEPNFFFRPYRYTVVYLACDSVSNQGLELPPQEWKELASALQIPNLQEMHEHAMEFERALGIEVAETGAGVFLKRNMPPNAFEAMSEASMNEYIKEAGTRFVRLMNDIVALSGRPFYEVRDRELALMQRITILADEQPEELGLISALMIPAFARHHESLASCEARLRITQAYCRLRADAKYPEKLEIKDPFTGKPMAYRREGAGFHLYSFGPNRSDDGGDEGDTDSLKDDIGLRVMN